ncbi:MAG: hypothetical protein KIT31_36290, partial [Deltaproteobacteria bacterium]|nr:hypothetical protein [Deltaproteobacteria bacterium]
ATSTTVYRCLDRCRPPRQPSAAPAPAPAAAIAPLGAVKLQTSVKGVVPELGLRGGVLEATKK